MKFLIHSRKICLLKQLFFFFSAISLFSFATATTLASPLDDKQKLQRIIDMYNNYKKSFPSIRDIRSKDAQLLLSDDEVIFVDTRKDKEQEISMIPRAITQKQFLKNIQAYREKTIIVYCTISYRSGKFAVKMAKRGINVMNLQAGLLGWVHAGGTLTHNNQPIKRLHVYGKKWDLAPAGIYTTY